MKEKKNLYYFSSVDYGFLKQMPQQLFDCWRECYSDRYQSFYVETFRESVKRKKSEVPGVVSPVFYYTFSKLSLDWLNCINRYFIRRMLAASGAGERYAIACNALLEPYLDHDLFDVICYDHLDSLEVHLGTRNYELTKRLHDRLLDKCDIVFVTADKLKQEIEAQYPDKMVVPVTNGVQCDFFREKRGSYTVPDYKKGTRPSAGYIGAIWEWIDVELVHEVARLTPEIDYLMVGPVNAKQEAAVASRPANVFYLGRKSYEMVPSYLELFDVALIPFVKSDISESTDPIKLYEYFALGKPVVTTKMRQLLKFNDGALLTVADTAADFAAAIRGFVSSDPEVNKKRREKLAEENSWSNKAAQMVAAIESFVSKR